MNFFSARNLTERSLVPLNPWEFTPTEEITEQIRHDKEERQNWYRNVNTRHSFYTLIEAANPNQRASREDNPPKKIHGVVADYDMIVPPDTVKHALEHMKIRPSWVERSLGGNSRFVWLFPRPVPVESFDFAVAFLQGCIKWLNVELVPGIDRPASEDPTRLFCNGCVWESTGHGPVPEEELQAYFVEVGRNFRFESEEIGIPLDAVEKALVDKFPHFCWPSEFVPESTGPSFWVPGSQSSNSAILKPDGFFTFASHADKPFYTWGDILGSAFVDEFSTKSTAKATKDVWFDGRSFWRRKKGVYTSMEMSEMVNYLKVTCGVTTKGGRLERTLSHIYEEGHVENAAPYLFHPPGLLIYQGRRRLNTSMNELVPPAAEVQTWGATGNFPFLSSLIDNIFTSEVQRDHFLAWFKYFYESGMNQKPMPGPAVFLMGGVCTGKTFMSREVVGRSVGGFVDASSYVIKGSEFNSHLFESPLWALDDDTVSDSPQAAANVQAMLKKSVANNAFLSNKKFQSAGMVEWMGRVIATTNTDYISSRMLGPLDNSSLDKISVFRCQKTSKIQFPSRTEMERLVRTELPSLLRWLVDHVPPDHVKRDSRFGFKSWHEPTLMEQAAQTGKSAPFKEVLIAALTEFFDGTPAATEWRGTVSQLLMQMHLNPMHECVIRTLKLEQVSRYLENVEKDGALFCRTETGALNTRIWVFPRIAKPTAEEALPQQSKVYDR